MYHTVTTNAEKRMTCGIYAIFDSATDECLYVGQSLSVEERWRRHLNDLRNGNHSRKDFIDWFKNNDEDPNSLRFEIKEICPNTDSAKNSAEIRWFNALQPKFYGFEPGMNFKWRHSEETKRKIGAASKGVTLHKYVCKSCNRDFLNRHLNRLYCSKKCADKRSCIEINDDLHLQMKKLYEVDRMTMKAISIELGISDATVHKLMVKFDIPRRARGSR